MASAVRHHLLYTSKTLIPWSKRMAQAIGRSHQLERFPSSSHPLVNAVTDSSIDLRGEANERGLLLESIDRLQGSMHSLDHLMSPVNNQHSSLFQQSTSSQLCDNSQEMINVGSLVLLSLLSGAKTADVNAEKTTHTPFPECVKDIRTLNMYMEEFFTREDEEPTGSSWTQKLPTEQEAIEAMELITKLYNMETFSKCGPEVMLSYPELAKSMTLTVFQENYCVLHEKIPTTPPFKFPRCFGYVVIASPQSAHRSIHHSASHFESDGQVCDEAAVIFEQTYSRSLVVAGASRWAINGSSPWKRNGSALIPDHESLCQKGSTKTDAAHNTNIMFHKFNMAIKKATAQHNDEDTFIQWHGMAESSCTHSDAFVSAGCSSTCPIYETMSTPNKIATAFNLIAVGLSASTPKTDNGCKLTGGTNLFGRYVNGVPEEDLCTTSANDEKISGKFIHIEQKRAARNAMETWEKTLSLVFPSNSMEQKRRMADNRVW